MSPLPPPDPQAPAARRPAPTLEFVIPCYNEQDALPQLLDRLEVLGAALLRDGLIRQPAGIVLVDDGSSDRTWPLIVQAGARLPVTGVRLSRNHGHQNALLAGLGLSRAEVVVSMDADLQDDPQVVADMLDAWAQGAEIVYGVRRSRGTDTAFKRLTARGYYRLMGRMGVELVPDHADFRLMSRKALNALATFPEVNLFLRGMVPMIGFRTARVAYDRGARSAGESKYNLRRMAGLAVEGMTSFSVRPLRIITATGFAVALAAFAYALWSVLAWSWGRTVPGWASIVVPMYLLGGLHLIALGVIGEYVGKTYQEAKRRPRFIVDEVVGPGATTDTRND